MADKYQPSDKTSNMSMISNYQDIHENGLNINNALRMGASVYLNAITFGQMEKGIQAIKWLDSKFTKVNYSQTMTDTEIQDDNARQNVNNDPFRKFISKEENKGKSMEQLQFEYKNSEQAIESARNASLVDQIRNEYNFDMSRGQDGFI
jgi:hypothetical protein